MGRNSPQIVGTTVDKSVVSDVFFTTAAGGWRRVAQSLVSRSGYPRLGMPAVLERRIRSVHPVDLPAQSLPCYVAGTRKGRDMRQRLAN